MPRALWQDPYAAESLALLQDPARARAAAVEKIGEAQARAAEIAGQATAAAQLQGGNAQAAAQQQGGQAWGRAAENIGQTVSSIPSQIQQARELSNRNAMEKLQLAAAQRQDTTAQRLDEMNRNIAGLASNPKFINEDGTLNAKDMWQSISTTMPKGQSGPVQPPDPKQFFSTITTINDDLLKGQQIQQQLEEHKTNTIARLASSISQFGAPTEANPQGTYVPLAQLGIAAALKAKQITQQDANSFLVPMIEHPEQVPAMLKALVARSTLPLLKVSEKENVYNPLDLSKPVISAQPEPPKTQTELEFDAANPKSPTSAISKQALALAETAKGSSGELKPGRIGGKGDLVFAVFDPKTKRTTYQGQDVTDSFVPPRDPIEAQAAMIGAQVAQQARAQNFAELQAGRADLEKNVNTPYLTAKNSANMLRDTVALAKQGNKVAASLQNLEATMSAIRQQGLNRINMAEYGITAGAGNAFDRAEGWLGKNLKGEPVPPQIQKDLLQFADALEKAAETKYTSGYKAATNTYPALKSVPPLVPPMPELVFGPDGKTLVPKK
jgi:hypothetical protein